MIIEKSQSLVLYRETKAELVNNHLKEMCKFANIYFVYNSKNFNAKKHLNNSKLHLNDKGHVQA